MLRFVLRVLGLWLVAGAVVMAVLDGARSIAGGAVSVTPLGELWFRVHPFSLNLSQAVIERNLLPAIWDPGIVTVLLAPAALVFLVLGLLLVLVGRRRRRRDPTGA